MNREDIIRMAREAGAMFDHIAWVERDLMPVFERFAAFIAQHEREACAKVCKNEEAQLLYQEGQLLPRGEPVLLKMASVANYCAAAIRARGQA
jgi:hypothetical protein